MKPQPELIKFKPCNKPPALKAVCQGKISQLHQEEFDPDLRDPNGKTLLHYSAYLDLELISLYLIAKGTNITALDNNKQNIFHVMAYKGNYKALTTILHFEKHRLRKALYENLNMMKMGFGMSSINLQNTVGFLLTASIEADVEIKKKKQEFETELETKLRNYYKGLAKLFEVMIEERDLHNRNSLHYAGLSKFTWCLKVAEILLSEDYNQGFEDFLRTFEEVEDLTKVPHKKTDPRKYLGVLEEVKSILTPKTFFSCQNEFRIELEILTTNSLNTPDIKKHTPLHLASYSGNFNLVQLFVSKNAKKDFKDINQRTPLDMAKSQTVMRYLSSLEEATEENNPKAYTHLVNSGFNPNSTKNEFLITSLHQAVISKSLLSTVIDCYTEVNQVEWNLYTPLHFSCIFGNTEGALELINRGAEINALSQYEYTPLHLAAQHNHPELVEHLIHCGARKNALDKDQRTPLMLAAKQGSLQSLRALLRREVDIYCQDSRGWTALHYAGFYDKQKVIKQLVCMDSDYKKLVNITNKGGKTALGVTSKPGTKSAFMSNF